MYPVARLARQMILNRSASPLGPGEVHSAHLIVRPWDIDVFLDLNNGRLLTLFDLGRIGLFQRLGILTTLKEQGWYGTVAGTAVRYRKRITVFQRLELRTKLIGWDKRFFYFDQGFWRKGECCAHAVIRTAITTGKGIVPAEEVVQAAGYSEDSPNLPKWVRVWAEAENQRPWPPI